MIEINMDDAARRAGEALIAAGRAESPEARQRHRAEAELYIAILREREQARIRAAMDRREGKGFRH